MPERPERLEKLERPEMLKMPEMLKNIFCLSSLSDLLSFLSLSLVEKTSVHHTIDIFERLCDYVLPVLPAKIKTEMSHALEHLHNDYSLSVESVEDTMIVFGKLVWPYRKAYAEVLYAYEGKIGEKFLLAHLPKDVKKRYQEFVVCGGNFRDLHSGAPAKFFSSEERGILCGVLVNLQQDIRKHVVQAIHSTEQKVFNKKVKEFSAILEKIEHQLDTLRMMADAEQEHPQLAEEIRAHVRGFDLGLCFLGPEISFEDLCRLPDHFTGRKHELKVRA